MTSDTYRLNMGAARSYGEQSLAVFQDAGDSVGIGYVTFMQTTVDYADLWRRNELTSAVAEDLMSRLEPMVVGAREFGERNLLGHLLDLLGPIALDAGRVQEAAAHLWEAVSAVDILGNQICLAHALDHVALLGTRSNQPAASVSLLAATSTVRQHIGLSARLAEQAVFDQVLGTARKNLTPAGYEDAWMEGTRMSRKQAVQSAGTVIDAATR